MFDQTKKKTWPCKVGFVFICMFGNSGFVSGFDVSAKTLRRGEKIFMKDIQIILYRVIND